MLLFHSFLFVASFRAIFTIRPTTELLRFLENTSYDALVPPSNLPVLVSVQAGLYVLNEVDTRTQSFKLKFTTRLLWQDERISFPDGFYQLSHQEQKLIWFPDVVVLTALGGSNGLDHHLTGAGDLTLAHDGTIEYHELRRMLLSCPMDLHRFPFDTQYCRLEISVLGHYISKVTFQEKAFTYETKTGKELSITGWKLLQTHNFQRRWSNRSKVTVLIWDFEMQRLYWRHIVTYFLPTTALVFLSFVSFWIPKEAVPARIALVLTNFLSICVILRGAASDLPIVDYITPLEVYLITSITFILLIMVEYVVAMNGAGFRLCSCRGSYQIECIEMQKARDNEQEHDPVGNEQLPIPVIVTDKSKHQANDSTVDKVSKLLLPSSYILFVVFYFLYYLKYIPM